jgi:hypothetical protein
VHCGLSQAHDTYAGIRDLFEAAKAKSPAIIFIDEIDAVGSSRSKRDLSSNRQTLNQVHMLAHAPLSSALRRAWHTGANSFGAARNCTALQCVESVSAVAISVEQQLRSSLRWTYGLLAPFAAGLGSPLPHLLELGCSCSQRWTGSRRQTT